MIKKLLSKVFLGAFVLSIVLPAASASAGGNLSILTTVKDLTTGGTSAQEISVKSGDEIAVLARILNDTPAATGSLAFYAKLPAGLSYVSGSGKLTFQDASGQTKTANLSDATYAASGVVIGDLPANYFEYVSYKVKASTAGTYEIRSQVYNGGSLNVISPAAKITVGGSTVVPAENTTSASIAVKSAVENATRGDTKFSDSVTANRGDELYFKVIIDNSATVTAKGLAAYIQFPSAALEYVPGLTKLYYRDANGQDHAAAISDAVVNSTGAIIGDLPAAHFEYLIYKVKVSSDAPAGTFWTGNQVFNDSGVNVADNTGRVMIDVVGQNQPTVTQSLSLNATAYNSTLAANVAYSSSINANRGDIIKFRIAIANNGTEVLKNAKVTNSLPANMEYVAKSVKVVINGNEVSVPDNKVISLGDLNVGANGVIEFSAKVKSDTPANTQQLVYAANGTADGISQVSSIVNIYLASQGEQLPSTGPMTTILALILLAMFIAIASYMYLKESNALKGAVKLIKR